MTAQPTRCTWRTLAGANTLLSPSDRNSARSCSSTQIVITSMMTIMSIGAISIRRDSGENCNVPVTSVNLAVSTC